MTVDHNFLTEIRQIQVVKNSVNKTIKDLLNEFQSTKIRIPDYQRSFVWEFDKQCRFVESIFLQVPIPPIFLLEKYENIEGEDQIVYEVIDGVQRLTTLANFESGKLKLSGLERLQDLNQAKLSQLPLAVKDFFLTKEIDVIRIQSGTNPEVQFEVFGRLNQGAVALNAQELRNCMFHGEFNDFLLGCSRTPVYRELLKTFPKFNKPADGKPDKNRMQDAELILRFFTLQEYYDPELNTYPEIRTSALNKYMREQLQRKEIDVTYLNTLQENFVKAATLTKDVFYPDHYRRFIKKSDKAYFTRALNQSIFDIQMLSFIAFESNNILKHKDVIREALIDLCCYDDDFISAISRSTNTKVSERVLTWKQQLVSIFEDSRPYDTKLRLKKQLFANSDICSMSGIKIPSLDQADIYEGRLCHRSNLSGNDILKPKEKISNFRRSKNSKVSFTIASQNYETDDLKQATEIILDFIRDGMINKDVEYHIQRIQSLDFCGSPPKLSKLKTLEGESLNHLIPINRDENLYFSMGGRSETVQRLTEISSLFTFMQPFKVS